jgi:hypothetical protein
MFCSGAAIPLRELESKIGAAVADSAISAENKIDTHAAFLKLAIRALLLRSYYAGLLKH